jgi:hypothetical protein
MSEYSLALHPDSTSPVASVKVVIRRAASGTLRLTYHLSGALDDVAFPEAQPPLRTDELWKRSCFEAFLAAGDAYYELNFSPSTLTVRGCAQQPCRARLSPGCASRKRRS